MRKGFYDFKKKYVSQFLFLLALHRILVLTSFVMLFVGSDAGNIEVPFIDLPVNWDELFGPTGCFTGLLVFRFSIILQSH